MSRTGKQELDAALDGQAWVSPRRRLVGGLVDGGAATVAMSAAMYAARRAGWLGEPPPRRIVAKMLGRLGAREVPDPVVDAVSTAAHVGFGAAAGALFHLARPRSQRAGRALLEGLGWGTIIWIVSYAGWIPATGLLAPPQRDREGRPEAMFVAHLVFGATLGGLAELRRRERARRAQRANGDAQRVVTDAAHPESP